MACHGIKDDYAILDCSACGGSGNMTVLYNGFPPRKETCETCKGTYLVRVPIKEIPILDYIPEST